MSLLNAWISPAEAIVAVDTHGVAEIDGRLERTCNSKLSTIPHLNAVIAHQGRTAFHRILFFQCLKRSLSNFDEMCEQMPALLNEAEQWVPASCNVEGNLGDVVVIAGWSSRRNSMVGRQYQKLAGDAAFSDDEVLRFIAPSVDSVPGLSLKSGAVEKIAAAQVKLMRGLRPDGHFGGTLVVCRVTRSSITTTHRMQFQEERIAA